MKRVALALLGFLIPTLAVAEQQDLFRTPASSGHHDGNVCGLLAEQTHISAEGAMGLILGGLYVNTPFMIEMTGDSGIGVWAICRSLDADTMASGTFRGAWRRSAHMIYMTNVGIPPMARKIST